MNRIAGCTKLGWPAHVSTYPELLLYISFEGRFFWAHMQATYWSVYLRNKTCAAPGQARNFPLLCSCSSLLPHSPLALAAEFGHFDIVKMLFDAGAVTNRHKYDSPIVSAARHGWIDIVQFLVDHCPTTDINGSCRGPVSALYAASNNGHQSIVEFLLNRGADPTLGPETQYSPLCAACESGHEGVVKLLLSRFKANVNRGLMLAGAQIDSCVHPFWSTIYKDAEENMDILLLKSSPMVTEAGELHNVAVIMAAKRASTGDKDRFETLFQKYSPRHKHLRYTTPLLEAVDRGSDEIVKLLLENGADFNVGNINNRAPLSLAISAKCWPIVGKLLQRGAAITADLDMTG